MKTFLKIAAALALGFGFQANAFADKGHGSGGGQGSHTVNSVHGNQYKNDVKIVNQNTTINKNVGIGNSMKQGPGIGNNFKKGNVSQSNQYKSYGKYESCKTFKDYKGPCYKGKGSHFWAHHCWNNDYGCNLYWCPTDSCWFYWCEPYECYLPVEYVPCGCYVSAE